MYGLRSRSNSASNMSSSNGSSNLEQALTNILTRLTSIDSKISTIEDSVSAIDIKMDNFNARLQKVESGYTALETKVANVERTNTAVLSLDEQYKEAIRKTEVARVLNELHNKRLNVIMHNIAQSTSNAWENWETLRDKVIAFLRDTLKLDVTNIVIVDAHRLRVKKPRHGKPLPLIFKVATMGQKRLIAKGLKELKAFNSGKEKHDRVWVDLDHLPEKMQNDKTALKSLFLKARAEKKKPNWRADRETGDYCLFFDDKKHWPDGKINNVLP